MVAEHLKGKHKAQTADLYRAIGEFVVNFEHLMYASKNKANLLCGFGNDTALLLEPYSSRQTIDLIGSLIQQRSTEITSEDKDLLKNLVSDLRAVNTERNKAVHSTWFIGWCSDEDTDFSQANGIKYASSLNNKTYKINAELFDNLTRRCKQLYKVMFTVWPIDKIPVKAPPLHTQFSRSKDGEWLPK